VEHYFGFRVEGLAMCKNLVEYYIPSGYSYKLVRVKCGNTDPYGERAICDKCADDPHIMAGIQAQEEQIKADNDAAHSAGWGDF